MFNTSPTESQQFFSASLYSMCLFNQTYSRATYKLINFVDSTFVDTIRVVLYAAALKSHAAVGLPIVLF